MSDTTVTTGSESVEDRILLNIGDLPDDNTPESVQPNEAAPSEPTPTAAPGATPGEPVVPTVDPVSGQKPAAQQKQEPEDPSVAISRDPNPQPRFKQDEKNNLVRPDGAIVAHAGRERRYYERGEQLAVQNQQLNNVVNSLNAEVAQLKQNTTNVEPITQHMQTHGVTEQDLPIALQFYSMINRDPIDAVKRIVAHAESRGHNVRQALELQGSGGIDLSALNTMIEQKLAPILQTQQQTQTQDQQRAEAQQRLNAFIQQNPDFPAQESVVTAVLQKHPGMPLETAYWKTKMWFQENGFDFNRPLAPQIQQRQAEIAENQQDQADLTTMTKPLVNGGNAPVTNTPSVASADDSHDSIIKDAMRENGYKI